jgi:hypothetical protein
LRDNVESPISDIEVGPAFGQESAKQVPNEEVQEEDEEDEEWQACEDDNLLMIVPL